MGGGCPSTSDTLLTFADFGAVPESGRVVVSSEYRGARGGGFGLKNRGIK
jgi:hypothetical protein